MPGVASVDKALQEQLDRKLAAQGPGYVPRSHHLNEDGSPRFTNRLIRESSPYLLQHAHNPVNWYAWSDEAFERAERENKPIFLSVGYSTCHWCHVMERESFEDEEIAAYLNQHYIAIKVDREERPDIDSVYMTAVTILTGRGGWPMTVIMTPDKEPFFGGTYFPPRRGFRGNRAGLVDILAEMLNEFRNDPTQVVARAQELSQRVEKAAAFRPGPGVPSDKVIAVAAQNLARTFDPVDGGFGGAPKFPQPSRLALMLRYARRTADAGATAMVATTLDKMSAGGIYDQVGGGFHRYSTDAQWLVPHFEKMLYDNAQLATVYLAAWQHTADADYQRVAREILDYVAREMTSAEGGFYSATDADSPTPGGHDEEGWFFTWTPDELEQLARRRERRAGLVRIRRDSARKLRRAKHPSPRQDRPRSRFRASYPPQARRGAPPGRALHSLRGQSLPPATHSRREDYRRLERDDDRRLCASRLDARGTSVRRHRDSRRAIRARTDACRRWRAGPHL